MKQQSLNVYCGIVLPKMPLLPSKEFHDVVQSMQLVRPLFYYSWRWKSPPSLNFRVRSNSLENMFHLVNLRYLALTAGGISNLSSSIFCFWNLHTLIVDHWGITIAQIIERIPNMKLRTNYINREDVSLYFFSNLGCLHKLESFHGSFRPTLAGLLQDIAFPQSLKKLTIRYFHSKDHILENIGSSPLLEKLSLIQGSFQEHEWETVETQFCSLKFLLIDSCSNLEFWKTESTHFPRLVLYNLHKLKEVPSKIGEIPSLQSIHLNYCSVSAVESAKRILDEQVELGNEDLQVQVQVFWIDSRLKNLESHNFQVECSDELMYHD